MYISQIIIVSHSNPRCIFFTVCIFCVFYLISIMHINWTVSRNKITIRCYLVKFIVMYVICIFVCVHWFFCMSLCIICLFPSNVNSIVYTIMYVHIFGYLVNKLEIWWVYLSPIGENYHCHFHYHYIHQWLHTMVEWAGTSSVTSKSSLWLIQLLLFLQSNVILTL